MTLQEKCAQLIFPEHRFDKPDYENIVSLVKSGIGGICLFKGNWFDVAPFVNGLQNYAKQPLSFCADFENGVGQQIEGATVLPSNMAVGATDSEELAHAKGKVTGREARALGVPWVLAPVVDLQIHPRNPIIGTRAFGGSADRVGRLAQAFIRGVHDGGAMTCAKHFPGHGNTELDSHLELPKVTTSIEELRQTDLNLYRGLKGECDTIMAGHLRVDALDPDRPASLSRKILQDLLRREIGFEGLICTDALMMGGITKVVSQAEALVGALEAGADALMYPPRPERAALILSEGVRSGRLTEERLDESVERIMTFKRKAGLLRSKIVQPEGIEEIIGCEEHRDVARRIAEAAVTRVRDGRSLLPLTGRISFVAIDETGGAGADVFRAELSEHLTIEPGDPTSSRACVVAVLHRSTAFSGRWGLSAEGVAQIQELVKRAPATVVVSFGSPYLLQQIPDVPAFVCAYGDDEETQRAAARAVSGKIPMPGRLPVTL